MKTIFVGLCCSAFLLGCSNKPVDSDIATGLNEFWGTCAKVSDVKKTNGIEGVGGKAYQVSFTYSLEMTEDGVEKFNIYGAPPSCSYEGGANSQIATLHKITNFAIVKKGDSYTVTAQLPMVKSEKGWIFQ